MTATSEARAALERGRRVVLVAPPAPEQVPWVWDLLRPVETAVRQLAVVVCPDRSAALDWAASAPPELSVHAVTGLARAARRANVGAVDVLVGSLDDLTQLVTRTALKAEAIATVVVAWPEGLSRGPARDALDTLLTETSDARRVVLSWDPHGLRELLERHAFKAPVVGPIPLDDEARPLPPVGAARYALVTADGRLGTIRGVIDTLDPQRVFVWSPDATHAERLRAQLGSAARGEGVSVGTEIAGDRCELVICPRVPSREQFAALAARGPVVLLLTASQVAYARTIAAPLTALRLPGPADRAADAAEALRRRVAARLVAGDVDAELLLLEPLFETHDPAVVAGALLALQREPGAGSADPGAGASRAAGAPGAAQWIKLFLNVGKKDRVTPKDLVGALIKEVGLQKPDIGRIELRDTFSTVEVATGVAEVAVKKLAAVSVRGRRVQARIDRNV